MRIYSGVNFARAIALIYLARARPIASCSSPLLASGSMGFNDAGVDEDQRIIAFFGQGVEDASPNPALGPSVIAIIDRCAWAIAHRQIPPRRASSQNIEYPIQHPPVIAPQEGCAGPCLAAGNKGSITAHSSSDKSNRIIQSPLQEH